MAKQRELQERVSVGDHRLNEINEKIRHYETDEKSNTHRKEFAQLERQHRSLRRDADALNEELEISALDPKVIYPLNTNTHTFNKSSQRILTVHPHNSSTQSIHPFIHPSFQQTQEAHTKFVERVNNFKQITKSLDEKSESMKKEIREMKTTIDESEQSTGVVSICFSLFITLILMHANDWWPDRCLSFPIHNSNTNANPIAAYLILHNILHNPN